MGDETFMEFLGKLIFLVIFLGAIAYITGFWEEFWDKDGGNTDNNLEHGEKNRTTSSEEREASNHQATPTRRVLPRPEVITRGKRENQELPSTNQFLTGGDASEITDAIARYQLRLYHLTHEANVSSILKHGILSYNDARSQGMLNKDISDHAVQDRREKPEPFYNRSIHAYAPLYINPSNPMLYVRKGMIHNIVILEIDVAILKYCLFLFSDGNVAAGSTRIFSNITDLAELPWDVLTDDRWNTHRDGKRKRCAEFLVYPKVPVSFVSRLIVSNKSLSDRMQRYNKPVSVAPSRFFEASAHEDNNRIAF